jgi:hypothetical protein
MNLDHSRRRVAVTERVNTRERTLLRRRRGPGADVVRRTLLGAVELRKRALRRCWTLFVELNVQEIQASAS